MIWCQMIPKSNDNLRNSPIIDSTAWFFNKLTISKDYLKTQQNREDLKKIFKRISPWETTNYAIQIETVYKDFIATKNTDFEIYLLLLKYKALLDYQRNQFNEASIGFDTYFKLSKKHRINDTVLASDYAQFAICKLKLDSVNQFLSLIDSGIQLSKMKNNPFGDLSLLYYTSGTYYSGKRNIDTSRMIFEKALGFWEQSATKDYKLSSDIYKRLSYLELISDNNVLAFEYLNKSRDYLLKSDHEEIEMASIVRDKGKILLAQNQIIEAIKQFKMALIIIENEYGTNHKAISGIYRYLGLAYHNIGNYREAIHYYNLSLRSTDDENKTLTYRNLADAFAILNLLDSADKYYQKSLELLVLKKGIPDYQTTMGYYKYGQFLIEQVKNYTEGEAYLRKAIVYKYEHYKGPNMDLVAPLNILGTYYIEMGEYDRGIDTLQSALFCAIPTFNDRNPYKNPPTEHLVNNVLLNNSLAWKAYGFYQKYLREGKIKDLQMSYETFVLYLLCINETRKHYDFDESVKTSQEIHYVFNQAINVGYLLYIKTGNQNLVNDIFKFIEGKKSYTLFQSLSTLEKNRLLKVPKDLINRELMLKQNLGLIGEKLKVEKSTLGRDSEIKNLDQKAWEVTQGLDSIQQELRESHSGFYNLKYGFAELSTAEIIEKTPDETVFINFSLSDTLLNTIVFTSTDALLFSKPLDSSFYNHIRTLVKLQKKVDTDNSDHEFQLFTYVSHAIYDVLFGAIEPLILNKELIIIPDAELNYISFDALLTNPVKLDRPDYSKLPYLIKRNKTNVANSMQIYFHMKKEAATLQPIVLAFAPDYSLTIHSDSLPDEYRNLRSLDYSIEEISQIAKYFPTQNFTGVKASREIFSQEAKNAGVLHLALHTLINDEDPLYSKFLFTYNESQKSGAINTYELLTYNLEAELVVLSGCSTGDGELKKGEGVMSLSSGFQFAGVPAIVMSLWEVNDRFGSLVIGKFYENLADGQAKNEALYQAKLHVLTQGNALYAHPYYWAGLTLIGNEEPLTFAGNFNKINYLLAVLGGFLLCGILLIGKRYV